MLRSSVAGVSMARVPDRERATTDVLRVALFQRKIRRYPPAESAAISASTTGSASPPG